MFSAVTPMRCVATFPTKEEAESYAATLDYKVKVVETYLVENWDKSSKEDGEMTSSTAEDCSQDNYESLSWEIAVVQCYETHRSLSVWF